MPLPRSLRHYRLGRRKVELVGYSLWDYLLVRKTADPGILGNPGAGRRENNPAGGSQSRVRY